MHGCPGACCLDKLVSITDKDFPCKYLDQAANCEIGEITTWNRVRNHWSKDLNTEICAKSDLGLFTSEQKHSHGFWDHVCCHCCNLLSVFVTGGNCLRRFGTLRKNTSWICGTCILGFLSIVDDFGVPKVVPAQNDADHGDGNEPTRAMLHNHWQANTHRDQISRSGDTPSLWSRHR